MRTPFDDGIAMRLRGVIAEQRRGHKEICAYVSRRTGCSYTRWQLGHNLRRTNISPVVLFAIAELLGMPIQDLNPLPPLSNDGTSSK